MSNSLLLSLVERHESKAIIILTTQNLIELHVPETSIIGLQVLLKENMPIVNRFVFKALGSENQNNIRKPILLDCRK